MTEDGELNAELGMRNAETEGRMTDINKKNAAFAIPCFCSLISNF
jgi:hypothetical protein